MRLARNILGVAGFSKQLRAMTIRYNPAGAASAGIREYLDKHVVKFAKHNPEIAVVVEPVKALRPILVARYVNGNERVLDINNKSLQEVKQIVSSVHSQRGLKPEKINKPQFSSNPSIQGTWHPFQNLKK
eukprot:Colp12_sorted_trinity150504_noHs@29977